MGEGLWVLSKLVTVDLGGKNAYWILSCQSPYSPWNYEQNIESNFGQKVYLEERCFFY